MSVERIEAYMNSSRNSKDNKDRLLKIGALLKNSRIKMGLKQSQVASLINISTPSYSGYENGRFEPSVEMLVRLSYLFEIPLDSLCGKLGDVDENGEIIDEIALDTVIEMEERVRRIERWMQQQQDANDK